MWRTGCLEVVGMSWIVSVRERVQQAAGQARAGACFGGAEARGRRGGVAVWRRGWFVLVCVERCWVALICTVVNCCITAI